MIFNLQSPIEDAGKKIDKVELRDVRTGDIRKIGQPVGFTVSRSDPDLMEFTADHGKIFRYVQAMSGLTPVALDDLHPADYLRMSEHVQEVFTDLQTPKELPNK